jgi:hypothetical protein
MSVDFGWAFKPEEQALIDEARGISRRIVTDAIKQEHVVNNVLGQIGYIKTNLQFLEEELKEVLANLSEPEDLEKAQKVLSGMLKRIESLGRYHNVYCT